MKPIVIAPTYRTARFYATQFGMRLNEVTLANGSADTKWKILGLAEGEIYVVNSDEFGQHFEDWLDLDLYCLLREREEMTDVVVEWVGFGF